MATIKLDDFSPQTVIDVFARRQQEPVPTFSWLDVWEDQHSQMFTVAKTAGFDVLRDLEAAVQSAISNGETFETFRNQLEPILKDKGWWGRAPVVDPDSGMMVNAQLGSNRRLRIIYDTNLRMSFAAGHWARFVANAKAQPYLMYSCVRDRRTRPEHLAWDGTCLPINHPWWKTHYPPCGWNCRCSVIALSQARYDAMKKAGLIRTTAPDIVYVDFTNRRTGEVSQVPKGIDPGFGHNVGIAFLAALARRRA